MRVYHLLSEKYAKENLKNQRLKVSLFADLNDPFELLSAELKEENIRKRFRNWKEETNRNYGVLCFSRSWGNPVLWSHYADKHKGVCLGFDIPDGLLKRVEYEGERLPIDVENKLKDENPNNIMKEKLLTTKFKHWDYEEEERVIVQLVKSDKVKIGKKELYFMKFNDNLKIREIVVGARCTAKKEEFKDLLRNNPKNVEIIKARLAFTKFQVTKQSLGFK